MSTLTVWVNLIVSEQGGHQCAKGREDSRSYLDIADLIRPAALWLFHIEYLGYHAISPSEATRLRADSSLLATAYTDTGKG
jgi:hypothetical protein